MFRTYLWLDGEGFDPVAFQSAAGGSVEKTYRMNQGMREEAGALWKSPERRDLTAHNVDEELRGVLLQFRPMIERISAAQSPRIWAEVVEEYEHTADVSGVAFSHATLRLLADLRVGLDIDIVRRLR